MKHKFKGRLLSALLALCMVFSLLPTAAWAEEGSTTATYTYTTSSQQDVTVTVKSENASVTTNTETIENSIEFKITANNGYQVPDSATASVNDISYSYAPAADKSSATVTIATTALDTLTSGLTITADCTKTAPTVTLKVGNEDKTPPSIDELQSGYVLPLTANYHVSNLTIKINGTTYTWTSAGTGFTYDDSTTGDQPGLVAAALSYNPSTKTLSVDKKISITENVEISVTEVADTYAVTSNLTGTGVTFTGNQTAPFNTQYSATITVPNDTPLSALSVTIGGTEYKGTRSTIDGSFSFGSSGSSFSATVSGTTYTLTIPAALVTGPIVISGGITTPVNVTASASGATVKSPNADTLVTTTNKNEAFTFVVTPDSGKTVKTLSVKIGDATISLVENGVNSTTNASMISEQGGVYTITIPADKVTADVAITAAAVKMVTVTLPTNTTEVTAKHGTAALTGSEKVETVDDYTLTLTPATGKAITGITVTAGTTVDTTVYTWTPDKGVFQRGNTIVNTLSFNDQTGLLTIGKTLLTSDLKIAATVGDGIPVAQSLGKITSTFQQPTLVPGKDFAATYTPETGTVLPESFEVKLGSVTYTVYQDGTVRNSRNTAVTNSGITFVYHEATSSASEYGVLTIKTTAQTGEISITMGSLPTVTRKLINCVAQTASEPLVTDAISGSRYARATTKLTPNTGYALPQTVKVTVGATAYTVTLPTAASGAGSTASYAVGNTAYSNPTRLSGTAADKPYFECDYSDGSVTLSVYQPESSALPVVVEADAQPILTLKLTGLKLNGDASNPTNTRVLSADEGTYAITNTTVSVNLTVKSGFTAPTYVTVTVGEDTYSVTLPTSGNGVVTKNGVTVNSPGFVCQKNTGSGYTFTFYSVTKPITIQDSAVLTVTQNLTGVNTSNLAAMAILNNSWSTVLTEKPGYDLASLSVTVNGYTFSYDTQTGKFQRPSGFGASAAIPVTFDEETGKLTVDTVSTPITVDATAKVPSSAKGQLNVTVDTGSGETVSKVTYQTSSSNATEMTGGEDGVYSAGNLSLGAAYTVKVYTNKATGSNPTLTTEVVLDGEVTHLSVDTGRPGNTVASVLTDGALAVSVSGLNSAKQFTHTFGNSGYDLTKQAVTEKLEMQITDATATVSQDVSEAIEELATEKVQVSTYINIATYKLAKLSKDSTFTALGTAELYDLAAVELTLPNALLGKTGLTVYCYEDGEAAQLGTAESGFKDYYTISEDGKTLTIHTDTPSAVYALAYDAPTYTVTFVVGDGGEAMEPVKVLQNGGEAVTVELTAPKAKEGYLFQGWFYDAQFTKAVEDEKSISITADTTLYAQWKVDEPDPGISFTDVTAGQWFYNAVMACAEQEIVNGYEDGTFKPNNYITRAEAAKIIAEAVGIGKEITPSVQLSDISTNWAKYYIIACANHGIITGDPDGSFRPNNYITRAETVQIIAKQLKLIDP